MNHQSTLTWFEEIAKRTIQKTPSHDGARDWYDHNDAVSWLTDAHSALASVFPENHVVRKSWRTIIASAEKNPAELSSTYLVDAARGVFRSAHGQLKSDRLGSIADGIFAESVSDLLDQAQALNDKNYVVAAVVIAGGALESHLLHLCKKNQLAWAGDGSISKYDGAVAQARNAGTEIYSLSYTKLTAAWGGIRNEAAHSPGSFTRSHAEIGSMITGIREFIARHP